MALELTLKFDDEGALRAWLDSRTFKQTLDFEPAPVAAEPEPTPVAVEPEPTRDELDGDGMPYDEAVHSDPPSFTADGLWRAKRGKADEAKNARAEFKASGGAVEPPVVDAPAGAALPGFELPTPAADPVTMEKVAQKAGGMLKRASIDVDRLIELYAKHTGATGTRDQISATAAAVLNVNESARANLFGELCQMEPELG